MNFAQLTQKLYDDKNYEENVYKAVIDDAIKESDMDAQHFLPDPRSFKQILKLPEDKQRLGLRAIKKEIQILIDSGTFKKVHMNLKMVIKYCQPLSDIRSRSTHLVKLTN